MVRGLRQVRPTLRTLRMEEVPFSGSGLRGCDMQSCPFELQVRRRHALLVAPPVLAHTHCTFEAAGSRCVLLPRRVNRLES